MPQPPHTHIHTHTSDGDGTYKYTHTHTHTHGGHLGLRTSAFSANWDKGTGGGGSSGGGIRGDVTDLKGLKEVGGHIQPATKEEAAGLVNSLMEQRVKNGPQVV